MSGPWLPQDPDTIQDSHTEEVFGMDRWTDSVALVTGASEGIGAEVARRLHAEGMRVVGCARRVDRLQHMRERLGGRFHPVACDLRNELAILKMFAEVESLWGPVDVLVNNAGLGHHAPLLTGNTDHWREMLEVNVLALAICTREAASRMIKRKRKGHILHISSMAAHRVPPNSGVYAATKHAVRALTEGLRMELREQGSGVRVTSISPGYVETGFARGYYNSEDRARETYSQFEVLQPEDVAEAVVYALAAPQRAQVHDLLLRPTQQPL
jgi:NADP-dependent 3-hydroxy acid dehydrogenase YdfG